MPASTSPLGLPYPVAADAPAGHTQMQSLAEATQTALGRVGASLQEGVIDVGSYEVTQASGGASTTVDIASHTGAGAYVQNDSGTGQALFYVPPTGAKSTATITAAHATLPRVDAVVVSLAGVVSIVAGTATSGATLDNARDGSHGGASIPSSALHLADLLVPATDTTISNSQIRDRRKWARGAHARITRNSGTISTISNTFVLMDSTNLVPRIECSGVPVRCTLTGVVAAAAQEAAFFAINSDSVGVDGMGSVGGNPTASYVHIQMLVTGNLTRSVQIVYEFTPTAGSHIIAPVFACLGSQTLLMTPTANKPLVWTVEEVVRQNTANNATTSG